MATLLETAHKTPKLKMRMEKIDGDGVYVMTELYRNPTRKKSFQNSASTVMYFLSGQHMMAFEE